MDDQNQPEPQNRPIMPPEPEAPVPQPQAPQPADNQPIPPSPQPVDAPMSPAQSPVQPSAVPPQFSPEPMASAAVPPEQQAPSQPLAPQDPPKKKRALKIILIVVGVIVALFIILVIVGSFLKPNLTLTEYKNTEFNYSIQRPEKWKEDTKTSFGEKITIFGDPAKDKNTYKAFMQINSGTRKIPVASLSQTDELFDQVQSSLRLSLSGFAPTKTDNSEFKGNKARRLEGTYRSGSETGKAIVLIVIESDGQAELVMVASPEKSFDLYEETFNEIIESFVP